MDVLAPISEIISKDLITVKKKDKLPVVENEELVGIVTTHDIIHALAEGRLSA